MTAVAVLSGYVALWDSRSVKLPARLGPKRSGRGKFRERIRPGAFKQALKGTPPIPFLINHNRQRPLAYFGRGLELHEDDTGLFFRALLAGSEGEHLAAAFESGDVLGMSFGMDRDPELTDDKWEGGDWGRTARRTIKRVWWLEDVSVCVGRRPAYRATGEHLRLERLSAARYSPPVAPSWRLSAPAGPEAAYLAGGTERRLSGGPRRTVPRLEDRVGTDYPLIVGTGAVFYNSADPGTEYVLWDDDSGKCVERIMPTAFDAVLQGGADVCGLCNHDPNFLLGRTSAGTMRLEVTGKGLRYSITPPDSPLAKGVVQSIQRGDLRGSSFSFTVDKQGQRWTKQGGLTVREIHSVSGLYDVGPVTFAAYGSTTAGCRAAGDPSEARRAFEDWRGGKKGNRARHAALRTQVMVRARCVELGL